MDQTTENNSSAYNQSTNKSPKLVYVLFLILVLGIGYLIFINFFKVKQISGLEVAERTAVFLDTTLLENGGMFAGFGCSRSDFKCNTIKVNDVQPHLGQAIYGYYSLSKISGDESYRAKSDKAIDFVIDECQKNIQMCSWNFFPLSRYYFDTKEQKYLDAMLRPADMFLKFSSEDVVLQNVGHKLASLYKATEDERYKNRLVAVANEELAKPKGSDLAYYNRAIQNIWSLYIPAYSITQDSKYLRAGEEFFDSFDLSSYFGQMNYLDAAVRGADALIELSKISSKGDVYKTEAREVLQEIMNSQWDSKEFKKVSGDDSFLEINDPSTPLFLKKTLNNGWLIKLFTLMPEEKFSIKSNDR